jgi:hypothetical protein
LDFSLSFVRFTLSAIDADEGVLVGAGLIALCDICDEV